MAQALERFPLIKLAKKLKEANRLWGVGIIEFPLIKLAKKLKAKLQNPNQSLLQEVSIN